MGDNRNKFRLTHEALAAARRTGRLEPIANGERWRLTSFAGTRAMVTDQGFHLTPVKLAPRAPGSGVLEAIADQGAKIQSLWHESHMKIRPVAAGALKPGAIADLADSIAARAMRLLSAAIETQAEDLETAFVTPLVGETFADLLGVAEAKRAYLLRCGTLFGGFFGHGATLMEASIAQAAVGRYFEGLLDAVPPAGAIVLRAAQDGVAQGTLTRDEAVTLLSDLLFGSLHATPATLAFLLGHLANAELRAALAEGKITLEAVIAEAARLRSARFPQGRVSTRDIPLGARTIPAGTRFVLDYDAINRDPDRFDDPLTFDPMRHQADELAFGGGLHRCVGRHLARIELRLGAEAFLRALPRLAPVAVARLAAIAAE